MIQRNLKPVRSPLLGAMAAVLLMFGNSACAVIDYQTRWLDSDRDGVSNTNDQCARTLSGVVVGKNGCDLFRGVISGVEFETDSLELTRFAMRSLDELATGMMAHKYVVLGVNAHTDNRGKATANLELSKRRVMVVVEYLVKKGIAPERLKPFGFGESRPVASNSTDEGRRRNRRIEIELLDS